MIARSLTAAALAVGLALSPARAADPPFRIGFLTTTTTPSAVIGRDMVDAVTLAIEHAGGQIGGRRIELVVEDDAGKPELGRQKAEKLVRQDNVDVVAGFIWANVLAAARKPILDAGKTLITTNAATNDIAGRTCHPNIFSTRGQADVFATALGTAINGAGSKKLYLMAPNYIAGKDFTGGVERAFKGAVAGRDFTRWGDDPQLDFSAEFAKVRASGADALFGFYPGRAAAAFARQFEQSGLAGSVKLYTLFTLDQLVLPALQQAEVKGVLGSMTADFWSPELDNPANRRFVADFRAKYGRYPSNYAAASYDLIPFLKTAVETQGGTAGDASALRAGLRRAQFDSVRGRFILGPNQLPIDDYYAVEVVADASGTWTLATRGKVLERAIDPYASECKITAGQ